MLKLTENVEITIFLLCKQETRWNFEFFEFLPIFLQKIAIFRSDMFLWCHNYVAPWPIVLILICMDRGGPYLPIDTKINFIGGSVRKI